MYIKQHKQQRLLQQQRYRQQHEQHDDVNQTTMTMAPKMKNNKKINSDIIIFR